MEIDELTLCWLAGLLEGEGHFGAGLPSYPNKPILSLVTTDEDVAAKVASLFDVKYYAEDIKRGEEHHWRQAYQVKITGQNAVQWMKRLYPLMGSRRQAKIAQALEGYKGDRRKVLSPERIEELRCRLQNGEHVITLAMEFGVSKTYAYSLRSKRY